MSDSLILNVVAFAAAVWFLRQWHTDLKTAGSEDAHPNPLPGAAPCPTSWIVVGAVGAAVIVGLVTAAEFASGVADEQSTISPIFLLGMLGAAVIEEMIFRGWLVIDKKGKAALIGSCIGVSLIFALGHQYMWTTEDGFQLKLEAQPIIATLGILTFSLWAYALRFLPANPGRSLLPCFVAHAVHNLVVFGVKLATGHVAWSMSLMGS